MPNPNILFYQLKNIYIPSKVIQENRSAAATKRTEDFTSSRALFQNTQSSCKQDNDITPNNGHQKLIREDDTLFD